MLKQHLENEVAVTDDVICNRCGRSCDVKGEDEEFGVQTFVFVEIKPWWGYYSDKDMEVHRSHLCERCYDELVASFVIPPEVREYVWGEPFDPFGPEVERRMRAVEEE